MKKILVLNLIVFLAIVTLQGQAVLERVICTTGGTFLAEGNQVELVSYDYDEDEATVIGSFLGDFSNDIAIEGKWAYAHIGRGFGNPAGMDIVYKVNLTNGEVVDSLVNIPGVKHLDIQGNLLIVAKGFGASGSNLEFYNKNELSLGSLVAENTTIPATIGGLLGLNNNLYVGYNEDENGKIDIYDLSSDIPEFSQTIVLDTLTKGLNSLVTDDDFIYVLSNYTEYDMDFNEVYSFGAVSKVSLEDGTFTSAELNEASGGLVVAPTPFGNFLIGEFGSAGNLLETGTLSSFNQNILPSYTDGIPDGVNTYLWIQETDYFSFGKVTAYNTMGEIVTSFDTDISGSAIGLVNNNPPVAINDEFQIQGTTEVLDVLSNDLDADVHELTLAAVSNIEGGTATITNDNRVEVTLDNGSFSVTFDYILVDIWDSPATASAIVSVISDVKETIPSVEIFASPNPTSNFVNLDLKAFDNGEITFEVLNLAGEKIITSNLQGTMTYDLDLTSFTNGIYFVKCFGEKKVGAVKVVKF